MRERRSALLAIFCFSFTFICSFLLCQKFRGKNACAHTNSLWCPSVSLHLRRKFGNYLVPARQPRCCRLTNHIFVLALARQSCLADLRVCCPSLLLVFLVRVGFFLCRPFSTITRQTDLSS